LHSVAWIGESKRGQAEIAIYLESTADVVDLEHELNDAEACSGARLEDEECDTIADV
jgi:hypothetical protein